MSTEKLARIGTVLTFAALTACATAMPQRDESIMSAPAPMIDPAPAPVWLMPEAENPPVGEIQIEKLDSSAPKSPPAPKKQEPVAAKKKPARRFMDPERFVEANEENLLFVFVSMPKTRVTSVMGTYRARAWSNPCKEERRVDENGQVYEVYFYLTRKPLPPRRMGERIMTPIVFAKGRVASIGRYGLKKLRAQTQLVDATASSCANV